MQNGKGDKWRKGFDYSKYWNHFDEVAKKEEIVKPKKITKLKGGKIRYIF
jgi:hypothetical protein